MDFITIDFETATRKRESACEIGLTFVKNSQITETVSWLIKPVNNEFEIFNTLIHGIKPEHVANSPEFNVIWKDIEPLIRNQLLIAHNASFDFSVLRRSLDLYQLPHPNLTYLCSYLMSKNIWHSLPAYDLKTLCKINNIKLVHHKAADDSLATAKLCLTAFDQFKVKEEKDFRNKLALKTGRIYSTGYSPCIKANTKKNIGSSLSDNLAFAEENPESIFYNKKVVFTGTLSSMQRATAERYITDIGGFVQKGVTLETNFLIVGFQDYKVVGEDGMSNKQEKAIKMIEKGIDIEILSEADFLKNIEPQ